MRRFGLNKGWLPLLCAAWLAVSGCGLGLVGVAVGAALAGGGGGGGGSPGTTTNVPGSPGLLFWDKFEDATLAKFFLCGSPAPSTTPGGVTGNALNPGGSATAYGEVLTDSVFRPAPGLAITADLQVGALGTAFCEVWAGLAASTSCEGAPVLDAGVRLVSATNKREFHLNGSSVFSDTLPDTNWHTYLVNVRPDSRVEFYADGILVHTTTGFLQKNGLMRPVTVGGTSQGATVLADNLYVTGAPPAPEILFSDGFSSGSLSGTWTTGTSGSTGPTIDTTLSGKPKPGFDPGGDTGGMGEALSVQTFRADNTEPIEIRAEMQIPLLTQTDLEAWFGFEGGGGSTADGVRDLAAGVVLDGTSDTIDYYVYSGGTETYIDSEPLDTAWHLFQIIIRPDGYVEFHRDGMLVLTTSVALPTDGATLQNLRVSIGGNSTDAPARIDNVAVIEPGYGHAFTSTKLAPTGTAPVARSGQGAIYDPGTDSLIIHGGGDASNVYSDAWCLWFDRKGGSGQWIQLTPTGTAPQRTLHGTVYDPIRQRMLVFGGTDGTSGQNSVHAMSLSNPSAMAWTALSPSGTAPSARWASAVIFDEGNDRLIVFGGDTGGGLLADVHTLQFTPSNANGTWATLTPSTATAGPPSARRFSSGYYDAANRQMVIAFGDDGTVPNNAGQEGWTISLTPGSETWGQIMANGPGSPPSTQSSPGNRAGTAVAGWSSERRLFIWGGVDIPGGGFFPSANNEVWTVDLSSGSPGPQAFIADGPGTSLIAPRQLHSMIWHPGNRRLIMFGGENGSTYYNDAWEFRLP